MRKVTSPSCVAIFHGMKFSKEVSCDYLWLMKALFLQANVGQDEDFNAAKEKAETLGAKKVSGLQ